jgi:hypothetical protein
MRERIFGQIIKQLDGFIEKADDTVRTFLGLGKREEVEIGEGFQGGTKRVNQFGMP